MALMRKPAAQSQTSVLTDVAKSTSWPRPFLHGRVPDLGAYSPGGGISIWFQNTKQGLITQLPAFQISCICCIWLHKESICRNIFHFLSSSASKLDIKSYSSQRDRRLEMMYWTLWTVFCKAMLGLRLKDHTCGISYSHSELLDFSCRTCAPVFWKDAKWSLKKSFHHLTPCGLVTSQVMPHHVGCVCVCACT